MDLTRKALDSLIPRSLARSQMKHMACGLDSSISFGFQARADSGGNANGGSAKRVSERVAQLLTKADLVPYVWHLRYSARHRLAD